MSWFNKPFYLPFQKKRSFIRTEENSVHLLMLCARPGKNWPSGSGEDDFKIRQCIFTMSLLSTLGKNVILNIIFIQGCLCQVLLKWTQWFLRKRWKLEKFAVTTTATAKTTTEKIRSEKLT